MSRSPLPVICRKLFDVEELAPRWSIADLGVGPAHDPIVMLCLGNRFRSSMWQAGVLRDGKANLSEMPDDGEGFRTLRPFLHDTWLYYRRQRDWSLTVSVVTDDGQETQRFPIDEPAHDIAVTSDGDVWSWYPDHAVYSGNWLSSSGLCCLDADGASLYHHNGSVLANHPPEDWESQRLNFIADCYAANLVSDSEIWAHWYTEFPLARIVNYRIEDIWTGFPFRGASAFAVEESYALFTGGYRESDIYLVDLATMDTWRLLPVDANQQAITYDRHYSKGQAGTLYLVNERTIHAVTVTEAVAAIRG